MGVNRYEFQGTVHPSGIPSHGVLCSCKQSHKHPIKTRNINISWLGFLLGEGAFHTKFGIKDPFSFESQPDFRMSSSQFIIWCLNERVCVMRGI